MKVEAGRLVEMDSCRPRLRAITQAGYWPRLIIADAEAAKSQANAPSPSQKRFARKLSFTYLGERARAEATEEQRQPGLVEGLVEQSIRDSRYREDLARTLFQLLVPHELKAASRQQDRIWLLVDPFTANLPWEMIQDGDGPLAARMRMVRQLTSATFRPQVRQATEKCALIIGNPSTEGFDKVFEDSQDPPRKQLVSLPGAEREANTVRQKLEQQGYVVERAIGEQEKALDVINKLLQPKSYRIVHIAAHGIVEGKALDGHSRTGVVLSDGLLITASEVKAMEVVPELVFLNCCHIGNVSSTGGNRLAASVSRELIEIGVKAVVAAGWAVDDAAGARFAEVLYSAMTAGRHQFGNALLEARKVVFREFPGTNTFGAYQAYGDPAFVLDPGKKEDTGEPGDGDWVSINEVLDEFARERVNLARRRKAGYTVDSGEAARKVERMLERTRAEWKEKAYFHSELGRFYADLGSKYFPQARQHYLAAIQSDDGDFRVPLRAVEQLANLEAREGETRSDVGLIDQAIERLKSLTSALQFGDEAKLNGERCAMLGSAYKRKAALLSNQKPRNRDEIRQALSGSIEWYRKGERTDPKSRDPYNVLNRLSLEAVVKRRADEDQARLARECGELARRNYQADRDIWKAIQSVDALVVAALLDGSFDGPRGEQAVKDLAANYKALFNTVHATERETDSVLSQFRLLARLFRTQSRGPVADRLHELEILIDPARAKGVEDAGSPEPNPNQKAQTESSRTAAKKKVSKARKH
jgi:CHAT domain-containing protein